MNLNSIRDHMPPEVSTWKVASAVALSYEALKTYRSIWTRALRGRDP